MVSMGKSVRYSSEFRERAVRLVSEQRSGYESEWAAIGATRSLHSCLGADLRLVDVGMLSVFSQQQVLKKLKKPGPTQDVYQPLVAFSARELLVGDTCGGCASLVEGSRPSAIQNE